MGVTVYPQLGALLAARQLSVSALEREIKARYGISVDSKTLYRLSQSAPVQRADLAIAGATAAILGVGLDDLFRVEVTLTDEAAGSDEEDLPPAASTRLADLFNLQARRLLTAEEQTELAALVAEYGRRRHERHLRAYSEQHGVSLAAARATIEADVAAAERWWQAFEADPARQRALVRRVKRQRANQAAPSRPDTDQSAAHG